MLSPTSALSGFSANALVASAPALSSSTLGLSGDPSGGGAPRNLPGGSTLFTYPKEEVQPTSFTIMHCEAEDIDAAVDTPIGRGIRFERYAIVSGIDGKP